MANGSHIDDAYTGAAPAFRFVRRWTILAMLGASEMRTSLKPVFADANGRLSTAVGFQASLATLETPAHYGI